MDVGVLDGVDVAASAATFAPFASAFAPAAMSDLVLRLACTAISGVTMPSERIWDAFARILPRSLSDVVRFIDPSAASTAPRDRGDDA